MALVGTAPGISPAPPDPSWSRHFFKGSIPRHGAEDGGLHAGLPSYRIQNTPPLPASVPPLHRPAGPPCRPCLVPPSTAESSPGTQWIGAPFHRVDTNRSTVQGRIPPTKAPRTWKSDSLPYYRPEAAQCAGRGSSKSPSGRPLREPRHAGHQHPTKSRPSSFPGLLGALSSPSSIIGRGSSPQCGGSTCHHCRRGRLPIWIPPSKPGWIPSRRQPRNRR